jgi:hypothetical protein
MMTGRDTRRDDQQLLFWLTTATAPSRGTKKIQYPRRAAERPDMARPGMKFLRSFKGLMLIAKVDVRLWLIIVIGGESLESANNPASNLNFDDWERNFNPGIMVDRQARCVRCMQSRIVAVREMGLTG